MSWVSQKVAPWSSTAIATGPESAGNDRYVTKGRLAQLIEVFTVYLRDNMLQPLMGAEASGRGQCLEHRHT